MENGTDYTSIELALAGVKEFGMDIYFDLYPNPELELAISDILRNHD